MQHLLTLVLQFAGIFDIKKLFICRDNSGNVFTSKLFWFCCSDRVLDSFPDPVFYLIYRYMHTYMYDDIALFP